MEAPQAVKFGDVVSLAAIEEGGFLHADSSIGCFVDRQRRFHPAMTCHGFHECLFRVQPKFQYSAFKACEKRLRHAGIHEINIGNWRQKLDPQDPDNADIIRYFQSVLDEQATNQREMEKSRGLAVLVGSVVQLLHVPSGKFLTQLRNRALNDRLAMEVGLDDGRKGSWWTLRAADGMTADGKRLVYRDRIVLESAKFVGSSVCLEMEEQSERTNRLLNASVHQQVEEARLSERALLEAVSVLHQTVSKRKEVTGSANAFTFQIQAFRQWHDAAGEAMETEERAGGGRALVRGLSVVTLCRKQEEEVLLGSPEQHRAVWVPRSAVQGGCGVPEVRAMWRVVPRSCEGAGQALPLRGGVVLLQCLAGGMYLTAVARGRRVALTPQREQEGCAWELRSVRGAAGKVAGGMVDGETVRVACAVDEGGGAECLSRLKQEARGRGEEGARAQGEGKGRLATLRESVGQMDCMEVQLVPGAVVKVVDRALVCQSMMEGLKRSLEAGRAPDAGETGGGEVRREWVEQLAHGATAGGRVQRAVESMAKACGAPQSGSVAQKVVRELGLMELAMELLEAVLSPWVRAQEEDGAGGMAEHLPGGVRAVSQSLYRLVERGCQGNATNGRVMLGRAAVMSRHLAAEVGAYSALLQIYSTSHALLEGLSDDFFAELAAALERQRDVSTVQLLIESCACSGVPVRRNQDRWVQHLLCDCPHLVPRMRLRRGQLWLEMVGDSGFEVLVSEVVRRGEGELLAQMEDGEEQVVAGGAQGRGDGGRGWVLPYHLSMLRLVQAMAAGRNPRSRQALGAMAEELGLSYGTLLEALELESSPHVLRAECCRLLAALYVDVEPHRTVPPITPVRTWSALARTADATPPTPPRQPAAERMRALSIGAAALPLRSAMGGRGGGRDLGGKEVERLKELLAREVGRLAEAPAQLGASGKGVFREEYLGGLVQLVATLLRFGFYHVGAGEQEEVTYWEAARLKELKGVAEGLFEAMGAGLAAAWSSETQSAVAMRRQHLIAANAEGVLKLMTQLLQHGIQHQVSKIFEFWESKVAVRNPSHDGTPTLSPVLSAEASSSQAARVAGSRGSPGDAHREALSNGDGQNPDRVPSADSVPLSAYNSEAGKRPLKGSVGVEAEEVRALCRESLLENPLLALVSATDFVSVDARNPPRVFRILFSLIAMRSQGAKESAFGFLIAVFYQRHALCSTLSSVQVVVSPELARKVQLIHRNTLALRRHVREVTITRSEGDAASIDRSSVQICRRILDAWIDECNEARVLVGVQDADAGTEVLTLLHNFNVPELLFRVLQTPVDVSHANGPGVLHTAKSRGLRCLLASAYKLLSFLCAGRPQLQRNLIKQYEEMLWTHAEIEGINPEEVMLAIAAEVPSQLKGWITRSFQLMEGLKMVRPCWLKLLRMLVQTAEKDRPLLVVSQLQELDMNAVQVTEVVNTAEAWDRRAVALAEHGDADGWLEWHIQSVELLAALSENRNPAAQIYASSHLTARMVMDTVASANVRISGEETEVPLPQLHRLRAAHLRFLKAVYVKTEVHRLFQEMQEDTAGFWTPLWTGREGVERTGLEVMRSELERCANLHVQCNDNGELETFEMVFEALIPMLCYYFEAPEDLPLTVPANRQSAMEVMNAARVIDLSAIPLLANAERREGWGWWQKRLVEAIAGRLGLQADSAVEKSRDAGWPGGAAEGAGGVHQQLRGLRRSFDELCGRICEELKRDADKAALPLLLCAEESFGIAGGRAATVAEGARISYRQAVQQLAAMAHAPTAGDSELLDLLLTLRLAIYVTEPSAPGGQLPRAEIEAAYERFVGVAPVEKVHGAGRRTVEWVQLKFDALGCTAAAMRLSSHPSKRVQAEALRLLLALLLGPNTTVQKSALAFLGQGARADSWFGSCSEILRSAIGTLHKAHKPRKERKARKPGASAEVWHSGVSQSGLDGAFADAAEALGRGGRLMLVLRVLELFCKKQCVAWQEVMTRQTTSTASYDLMRHCLDLLETVQPMLQSTQQAREKAMFVLAKQTVNTLTAMIQGPHESNQKALLSSSFLATVNRLFAGVVYVADPRLRSNKPLKKGRRKWKLSAPRSSVEVSPTSPSDASLAPVPSAVKIRSDTDPDKLVLQASLPVTEAAIDGHEGPSMNDLRCWFRQALLRCICSLFDAVADQQVPAQVLESLHATSVVNQISSSGELLLLTPKGGPKLSPSAYKKAHKRETWKQNVERGLGFSPGFEEAVENEMQWNYILLQYLQDFDGSGQAVMDLKKRHPGLHSYLGDHVSHVELSRRVAEDVRVDKMYFPVESSVVLLSKSEDFQEEMNALIRSVPRANSVEKFRDLLKLLKEAVSHLVWLQYISRFRTMRWIIRYRSVLNHAPVATATIITLLLLLFYGLPVDPNTGHVLARGRFFASGSAPAGYEDEEYEFANQTSDPGGAGVMLSSVVQQADLSLKYRVRLQTRWESAEEWKFAPELWWVVRGLGVVHVLLTAVCGAMHLVLDFPLNWVRSNEEVLEEARKKTAAASSLQTEGEAGGGQGALQEVGGAGPTASQGPGPPVDVRVHVSALQVTWRAMKRGPEVAGHSFFLALSVLGAASSPVLFVFCLADYFRLPGGWMVFKALRVGSPALFRSLVIGIIVISCFGVYNYAYFSQSAILSDDTCHSPFQCVAKHILDAVRGDITTVIGNFAAWAFPAMVLWSDTWYAWRTFVVLLFLLFWAFLLQPVIQGQIIDAFMKLRKERDDATEEMNNKCFISGIDRFKFDAFPGEWEGRSAGKYTWNYLFFLCWLMSQERESLTCTQLQVLERIESERPDFFPAGVSAILQRDEQRSDKDVLQDWLVKEVNERLGRQEQTTKQILAAMSTLEAAVKNLQGVQEDGPEGEGSG